MYVGYVRTVHVYVIIIGSNVIASMPWIKKFVC